jgi:hypothetical protein
MLKERLFGLTGEEGNHGEDVKEYYFYVDSSPTHSYMKGVYKYPQRAFPYQQLVEENLWRSNRDREYELIDRRLQRQPLLRYRRGVCEGFSGRYSDSHSHR